MNTRQPGRFERWANRVDDASGTLQACLLALTVVLVWAASGPAFHYSTDWQLVINTGTTIVTFLLGFLIKFGQRRSAAHMRDVAEATLRDTEMDAAELAEVHRLTAELHAALLQREP